RERKQQGQHKQDYADIPIELPRFLVGTREEHAQHVQLYCNHHEVSGPAVHVAKQFAEGHVVLKIEHVAEGLHFAWVVVEHQKNAGKREHNKQVESDAAHSPGVPVAHGVGVDFGGMEMQEDVR